MTLLDTQPPFLADVTGLPSYRVNNVIRRDMGNGIAMIINCWEEKGVIIPLCRILVEAPHMVVIGKGANEFALEMNRRQMLARLHALRIDGTAH
jgi:hypothetical protein